MNILRFIRSLEKRGMTFRVDGKDTLWMEGETSRALDREKEFIRSHKEDIKEMLRDRKRLYDALLCGVDHATDGSQLNLFTEDAGGLKDEGLLTEQDMRDIERRAKETRKDVPKGSTGFKSVRWFNEEDLNRKNIEERKKRYEKKGE